MSLPGDPAECKDCWLRYEHGHEGPCAACCRAIHESWHALGWWWIRPNECHPNCPGLKGKSQEENLLDLERTLFT